MTRTKEMFIGGEEEEKALSKSDAVAFPDPRWHARPMYTCAALVGETTSGEGREWLAAGEVLPVVLPSSEDRPPLLGRLL